ncbi:MAG: CofH family radical SAM protein, partial [Candidatus Altarchaeaceae archaeon]
MKINEIINKCINGYEFSFDEAKELLNFDLNTLGFIANKIKEKFFKNIVTFVCDTTINYTNICVSRCKFCAFWRNKDDKDAYTLKIDEIIKKIEYARKFGVTQVLIQGGLNPDIPLEYYENLIKEVKKRFPEIQRHFFSAPEIYFIAKNNKMSVDELLERFKELGLQSFGGGGAEILINNIRKEISPNKITAEEWKEVIVKAHKHGIKTSATMVYGFGESKEDRIKHLLFLRDIQKETGNFTAFIPWSFQPENTIYGKSKKFYSSSYDYLEIIALARIIFNKFLKNIQASWLT